MNTALVLWHILLMGVVLLPAAAPAGKPCPSGCNANGGTCNEETGRCNCPKHLTEDNCGKPARKQQLYLCSNKGSLQECLATGRMSCLNDCNGRGRCIGGWCQCEKGFWGSDCSLSWGKGRKPVLLEGRYKPRERRPRIYMYDLPAPMNAWHHPLKMDRPLPFQFQQRLLGSGVLTADGDDADWFYIPVKLRNTGDGHVLSRAISYVRSNWPWYDRYQGHRHFIMHTGDTGRAEVSPEMRDLTMNMTWLHHWGLTEDFEYSGWLKGHRPGKDLVIPIFIGAVSGHAHLVDSPLHPLAPRWPRTGTFLFAGRICGDNSKPNPAKPWPHCRTRKSMGYSQGVRQMVHYHHWNRTGFKVVTGDPQYTDDLMTYKYCLAPTGGGHGHRQTLVAMMGCVPVLIGDHVLQPFEPELDWSTFGVHVAQEDIPRLHEILAAITPKEYERRADALRCAVQHLIYSTMTGSFMHESAKYDAFELIIESLRMQQKYPGADPKDYVRLDTRFRDFVNCGMDTVHVYGRSLREAYYKARPEELDPDGRTGLPAQLVAANRQVKLLGADPDWRERIFKQYDYYRKRAAKGQPGVPANFEYDTGGGEELQAALQKAAEGLTEQQQRMLMHKAFRQVTLWHWAKTNQVPDMLIFSQAVAAFTRAKKPMGDEKLPLCIVSGFDPIEWNCLKLAEKSNRSVTFMPGGNYCAMVGTGSLDECPRPYT